jgi:hypothetical protein
MLLPDSLQHFLSCLRLFFRQIKHLISVKTAADIYQWTAEQIYKNPFIIYEWKAKPLVSTILSTMLKNMIDPKKEKNYPWFLSKEKTIITQHRPINNR